MFSPESFSATSFAPVSWKGLSETPDEEQDHGGSGRLFPPMRKRQEWHETVLGRCILAVGAGQLK